MNDKTSIDENGTEPAEEIQSFSPRKAFNEDENFAVLNLTTPDCDEFVEADRQKTSEVNDADLLTKPNELSLRARLKEKYDKHVGSKTTEKAQVKMIQPPKPTKKKSVTFNLAHKADDMIKNTSVKGIPQLGKKAGILNQNCYSFSKIPKWDGINVRSINPKRANWLYRNAARLGSKITRLNGLKEELC